MAQGALGAILFQSEGFSDLRGGQVPRKSKHPKLPQNPPPKTLEFRACGSGFRVRSPGFRV